MANTRSYPNLRPSMANFDSALSCSTIKYEQGKADIESPPSTSHDQRDVLAVEQYLPWRDRLKHFTFAWYASTMSTGGVAFTLSIIPNAFSALKTIGVAMFVVNIITFLLITILMVTRFIMHPGTFRHALANPHEGFFMATFWLTLATMVTNTTAYGVHPSRPWLIDALWIVFWVYTACTTLVAIFYYHVLFTVKKLDIKNVLPGWVLPIFPAMLVGTLASAIAGRQPAERALPMIVCGVAYQGLGMLVAMMMYSLYFGRLLTQGLPADASRPAMFIAVGPPAFTALAFIGMAQNLATTNIFPNYISLLGITDQSVIPNVFQLLALSSAIFLWVFAFWCFAIAFTANVEAARRNSFHLNWYAYVFPNVGFTIATIKIGISLDSKAIQVLGSAMGVVIFFCWIFIVSCHVRAVVTKQIMWPGKDEDAHH